MSKKSYEMTTVTAHRSSSTKPASPAKKHGKGKHKVKHMTIARAANGYTAETHYERPAADVTAMRKGGYIPEPDPETHVFDDHTKLAAHIKDMFGAGEKESPEEDASEGGEEED